MIISIHAEKAFDKTQTSFLIKNFSKLEIEENILKLLETIYKKPTANIRVNEEM